MSRRKSNKTIIVVLLLLVILAGAVLGGMVWFINSHFFINGKAYANDAQELDLRNQVISVEEYNGIRSKLPDCKIRWNVPFQNSAYPDDTTALSVESLSDADLKMLAYFPKLAEINAEECKDYAQMQALQDMYPNVNVRYTVSIGGQKYPQDAETVICHGLTDEEIELMAYLPKLKHVDASDCQDYERIGALTAAFPGLDVSYRVEMMGTTFTEKDTSATFNRPNVDELQQKLAWLPHMETIHLVEPEAEAEALRLLMDTYPNITFTWEKTVLGKTFNSAETEYNLEGANLPITKTTGWKYDAPTPEEARQLMEAVVDAMAYFPNAEKVIVPAYCLHNETMAEYREQLRPEYKLVWTVYVTRKPVRTDQEVIHSSAYSVCFIDEQSQDLVYCEDAIVVDIGHSYVKNIEWVKGMPKLKYLILTHNWVKDLTPLSTCKNLIYLELYWNDWIPDYSPLLGCTSLVDLNISGTFADVSPLVEMDWLDTLYANLCGLTEQEIQMLEQGLPDTKVVAREGMYTGGGWREVQGYFDMRDIMGLPYNHW